MRLRSFGSTSFRRLLLLARRGLGLYVTLKKRLGWLYHVDVCIDKTGTFGSDDELGFCLFRLVLFLYLADWDSSFYSDWTYRRKRERNKRVTQKSHQIGITIGVLLFVVYASFFFLNIPCILLCFVTLKKWRSQQLQNLKKRGIYHFLLSICRYYRQTFQSNTRWQ